MCVLLATIITVGKQITLHLLFHLVQNNFVKNDMNGLKLQSGRIANYRLRAVDNHPSMLDPYHPHSRTVTPYS